MKRQFLRFLLALTLIPATAIAAPPANWFLAGLDPTSYRLELDAAVSHSGKGSGRLASVGQPSGFGTMMQSFSAKEYLGKRVQLSAFVKAKDVANWAGMWMRVDGADVHSLAFDNMQDRPIKGTSDWTRYDIVLDVPKGAAEIFFGLLMDGTGTMWLDDISFQVVDSSVPVTGGALHSVSTKPGNLDFEN